jgi:lipoprotein-anchoring transpeptidase ErfK/SrfK
MTGTRNLLRGLLAVAALLTLAACAGLAAPADARADALPTTLTVQPVPPVIVYGSSVQLRVLLTSDGLPVAGASLPVSAQAAGELDFAPLDPAVTDAAGAALLQPAPHVNTTYRIEYAGDALHAAASADVLVRVRPRIATSFPKSLWVGNTAQLKGRVYPAHPGAQVTIERKSGGVWGDFATVTLADDSRFSAPFKPTSPGFKYFRVRMAADAEHALAITSSRRLVVNIPNKHGIPWVYPHYIVIDHSEFRIYYYEHGRIIRNWACVLGKPSTPTPLGHFKVYAKDPTAGIVMGKLLLYYNSIGIHGTNEPWLIKRFPRAFSHGCCRLTNAHIDWLYPRVPVGTPVWNIP